jgi:predicted nucleic acid-binding protein
MELVPADAVFIYLAQQAKADLPVSGDADILSLQGCIQDCKITNPSDFLNSLTVFRQPS